MEPKSARLYQILGESYRAQGQLDLAVRAYREAAAAAPKMPEIHLALAEIHLGLGNRAQARKEIEQELAIMPGSAAAMALKQQLGAAP